MFGFSIVTLSADTTAADILPRLNEKSAQIKAGLFIATSTQAESYFLNQQDADFVAGVDNSRSALIREMIAELEEMRSELWGKAA